jgi:uncharacterized membrane protein
VTYAPPFWLSHHRAEDAHKCFRLGGIHLCARCAGTYPVLLVVLVLQLRRPFAPVHLESDPWLFLALPLPAVTDWTLGQLTRWRGNNLVRFVSGCLLGGSLGRLVYVNLRQPGDPRVFLEILGLCAVAGIVWGIRQVLGLPREPSGPGEAPIDRDVPPAR